jgi:hypothetical protein
MNLRGDDRVGSIARVTEPQAPDDPQTGLDVENGDAPGATDGGGDGAV